MSDSVRHFGEQTTISVVIPVFNEESSLPELVRRCLAACEGLGDFEIFLVDDGSRDGSRRAIGAAAAVHPGKIVGIALNRNYGQHAAVMAGLAASRGDLVVTLDADLQNFPEDIPRIVERLRQGHDVVGGVRSLRHDTLFRRLSSRLVNRITARVTGVPMRDYGCMLRGYGRPVVDAMLECREHSTFLPVLANYFAESAAEIEVSHAARACGDSKYDLWKLINLQFDLLTATTKFPLRLLSILGVIVSLLGVGFGVLLLVLRLIHGAAWAGDGVFTLFAVVFMILGAQFVGMGLLGEYLGRVYDDVRARPRFLVREVLGQTRLPPLPSPQPSAREFHARCRGEMSPGAGA